MPRTTSTKVLRTAQKTTSTKATSPKMAPMPKTTSAKAPVPRTTLGWGCCEPREQHCEKGPEFQGLFTAIAWLGLRIANSLLWTGDGIGGEAFTCPDTETQTDNF